MYRSFILIFISIFFFISTAIVRAQSVDVVVYVADIAYFISGPLEVPTSSVSSPTNEYETITFSATAADPESSSYYFIICKTDQIQSTLGSEPTCPGGQWCYGGLTSNGNDVECEYTTSPEDVEINEWYAFVCSPGTGFCSDADQGTGDSGSPFVVNHAPEIISVTNNGNQDPGGTFVWTVEAEDLDVAGGRDLVRFFVCKTDRFENGACLDNYWCASDFGHGELTCSYQTPDVHRDQLLDSNIFVVDQHGLESSSTLQGSRSDVAVNNVAPKLSNINLNNGDDIDLIAGTSTIVKVTTTVSDRNSCAVGEIVKVTASLYRSSIGYEGCRQSGDVDNNNCYPQAECVLLEGEVCEEGDTSQGYECYFDIVYHAEPTDSGSIFSEDDWRVTVYAEDENGASVNREVSVGVDVNSLLGLETDHVIIYGSLFAGETIDPVSKATRIFSSANLAMDAAVFGTGMSNSSFLIPADYQRYASTQVPFSEASVLRETPSYFALDLSKPTGGIVFKRIYWGIQVPKDLPAGNYSGENYLIGIKKRG